MRRWDHGLFILLISGTLAGCRRADTSASTAGRLSVALNGRTVLDAPAAASRCLADTTVVVTAVTTHAVAAVALRVSWPPDSALTLPVAAPPAGPGTASVAYRVLGDSILPALVGARGTVHLAATRTVDGTFEVTAPTMQGAPDSSRLTGRLTGIPMTDDLCPGTPTP